jgi:large subunit ribosomal protein L24
MMKKLMTSGPLNPAIKPAIREAEKKTCWDIVRGDRVQVIVRHPEAGKQGIVQEMIRKQDRLIVTGVNMKPKRIAGNPEKGIKGTTVMKEQAIHYSNVNLVDPVTNVPTRIFCKVMPNGTKVRVSKASGAVIPKPEIMRRKPASAVVTKDCTLDDAVWEITYPHYQQEA